MLDYSVNALRTFNEFLTAGIAITAFSLLLYALSFNLKDRVARSFAFILVCVVIVYVGDAMASVSARPEQLVFWLRMQWPGIIFLPAAYLHFSDALLATTGRPSRGRRRLAVRLIYGLSFIFLATFLWWIGPLQLAPTPYLSRTLPLDVFTVFYTVIMVVSWINFYRAFQRSTTSLSRRRMSYLILGALAPAFGCFPYLIYGGSFAVSHSFLFWLLVNISNILISILLVLMAYAVAFFGVPWPDRVVKRRLFKWLMRGPVTASTTLMVTTLVRRADGLFGIDWAALAPAAMVATILIFEHLITLLAPIWERWLFYGRDRADVELLQTIEERLLTSSDLRQFLESILVAVCDRLQASQAFIAVLTPPNGDSSADQHSDVRLEMLVTIGGDSRLEQEELPVDLLQLVSMNGLGELFNWGDYWLVALADHDLPQNGSMLGLLGILHVQGQELDQEQSEDLATLVRRAGLALRDRRRQEQLFTTLEMLTPQVEMIQRLRAAARYEGTQVLTTPDLPIEETTVSQWVKDALTHYWGGPKLTQSPLLELQVVQQTVKAGEETPANALRSILRKAIDQTRPEGERRFTTEWLIYNLLEMKFLEGRKVREVAMRLAMSEADLYRKQRVAIEAVANTIVEMEMLARQEQPAAEEQPAVAQDKP